MSRSLVALGALILLTPVAIERRLPADGAAARYPASLQVEVAGGYDYYAFIARGCNGEILDHLPVNARDAGGSISYSFRNTPFRVGVRGGWVGESFGHWGDTLTDQADARAGRTFENVYVNPNIEVDGGSGAIGCGWVAHRHPFTSTATEDSRPASAGMATNDFSFHVRLGSRDRKYFLLSWMEEVPIESGGGYLRIGIGGQTPTRRLSGLVGFATGGPQEGMGPLIEGSYLVTPDLALRLTLHNNLSTAGGIGVGLRYSGAR